MKKIPFVVFGNKELEGKLDAHEGQIVMCKRHKDGHPLKCGIDTKTKKKSRILLFYDCGKKSFLGAVAGKLLVELR